MDDTNKTSLALDEDLILLKIFSFLSVYYLDKLRLVSKKWQKLINEIKSNRKKKIEMLLFSAKLSIESDEFKAAIKSQLVNVMNEPNLVLLFLNKNMNKKCLSLSNEDSLDEEHSRSAKRRKNAPLKIVPAQILEEKLFPKSVEKMFVYVDGLIATNTTQKISIEIEHKTNSLSLSGVLLPNNDQYYRFFTKPIQRDGELCKCNTGQELND